MKVKGRRISGVDGERGYRMQGLERAMGGGGVGSREGGVGKGGEEDVESLISRRPELSMELTT